MRTLIIGNSGSGKSSYAALLSEKHSIPHLDLDSIVWEPGQIAIQRPIVDVELDLFAFAHNNDAWIIEGCYGELAQRLIGVCTELVFMNPGIEACIRNNQNRPWEPAKYRSESDQRQMLANLLNWVSDYYTRNDSWSYKFHRNLYDTCTVPKRELSCVPSA